MAIIMPVKPLSSPLPSVDPDEWVEEDAVT